jgi:hypothetical protein
MLSEQSKTWIRFQFGFPTDPLIHPNTRIQKLLAESICQNANRLPEIIKTGIDSWSEDFADNSGWSQIRSNIESNLNEAVEYLASILGLKG